MRVTVEIILLDTEDEYRNEYLKIFVQGNREYKIWEVPISFDAKSFDHIFYEPENESSKKGRFSKRRAKKMLFVDAILNGKVNVEIMFQPERGTFAIFCEDLDCVMYLRNRVGTGKLQIGSFFDFGRDHTKMFEKQRKKCVGITKEEFKRQIK